MCNEPKARSGVRSVVRATKKQVMIPYSIADIENENVEKDPHTLFKSWGYSEMDIARYEMWRRKK